MKIILLVAALGGGAWLTTCRLTATKEKNAGEQLVKLYSPARYDSLKKTVAAVKKNAGISTRKDALVNFVGKKMFPFWYDTEWDFNGTTEVPRQGTIACGYFVTTVLRDAGVKLDRVQLAQCASEQMIKTLTTEEHIRRYSNYKIEKFCIEVKKHSKGIYVVGLDSHTGFLLNTGDSLFFIHANGYNCAPKKVIKEFAQNSEVLSSSAYKVVGYLTDDANFLESWQK